MKYKVSFNNFEYSEVVNILQINKYKKSNDFKILQNTYFHLPKSNDVNNGYYVINNDDNNTSFKLIVSDKKYFKEIVNEYWNLINNKLTYEFFKKIGVNIEIDILGKKIKDNIFPKEYN